MSATYWTDKDKEAEDKAEFDSLVRAVFDEVTQRQDADGRAYASYDVVLDHPGGAIHAHTRHAPYGKADKLCLYLTFDHLPGFKHDDIPYRYFKRELDRWASDSERERNAAAPSRKINIGRGKPADKIRAEVIRRLGTVAAEAEAAISERIAARVKAERAALDLKGAICAALGIDMPRESATGAAVETPFYRAPGVSGDVKIHRENAVITINLNCGPTWDEYNRNHNGPPALGQAAAAELAGKIKALLES